MSDDVMTLSDMTLRYFATRGHANSRGAARVARCESYRIFAGGGDWYLTLPFRTYMYVRR